MADRSIVVRLKAEVKDFEREMGRAGKSLDDVVKRSGDTAGAASTVMGRMVQSARLQSDAWGTVGSAALGVGTAMTAVNVAVAKTGIEYQMLQQSSRAALTTLMGGAEAANAQMDKLDDFARTSPFAKDVFIRAQQQMLGFGIEAGKVIPYLDSINEAVAAAGGSNQDIAELSRIFSQIQASAKITATDLREFGNRGIDAATLIGSQMGKTGAQIRDEITAGTLDAGEALDALAGGMQQRFGGASENVKNTLVGAFDRVKAAWRDLSAELVEGAVGTDGGGWLVGATNDLADFVRFVKDANEPTRDFAFGLSAIAGVSLLGVGGVLHSLPRLLEFKTALDQLAEISPRTASGLKGVARAAGGVAAAFATIEGLKWLDSLGEGQQDLEHLAATLEGVAGGTRDLDAAFRGVDGKALSTDLFGAVETIYDLESAMRAIDLAWWSSTEANKARDAFKGIDDALKQMDPAGAAQTFAAYEDRMRAFGWTTEKIAEQFPRYFAEMKGALQDSSGDWASYATDAESVMRVMRGELPHGLVQTAEGIMHASQAMEEGAAASGTFADGLKSAADAALEQAEATQAALNAITGYYDAVLASESSAISLEASFDRATEAAEKNGKTLDINTEKGRANREALLGIAGAAIKHAEDLGAAGASTDEITSATQRAREQFVKAATDMGMSETAAADYADQLGLIPSDVATSIKLPGVKDAQAQADLMWDLLAKLPPEVRSTIRIGLDKSGYWEADRILNSINGRTVTANIAIRRYGNAAMASGGHVGEFAQGLAYGGRAQRRLGYIAGAGSTTADQVPTWLSAKEFVQNATATAYYGVDAMYALNARAASREAVRAAIGLAAGGQPLRYEYRPTVSTWSAPQSSAAPSPAFDPGAISDAIRDGLAGARFLLDGKELDVKIGHAMSRAANNVRRGA